MKAWNIYGLGLVLACAALASRTSAETQQFPPEQISRGAEVYANYCVSCHGWQMEHPGGSFDLRAFPSGQFTIDYASNLLQFGWLDVALSPHLPW